MPNIQTRSDSIRNYLTGAGSDGGAQASAAASLGNFRSSTEALSYGIAITNPIANITVAYAGGGNAPGNGSLQCIDANTLQWQDSSGAGYGPAQSIANGQTMILETSGNPGAYIRVTRTSATALVPGTATVTLTTLLDDVFSMSDVTSAEALAGETTYRAFLVRNENTADVTNFQKWIGLLGTAVQSNGGAVLGASGSGTISTNDSFSTWPLSGYAQIREDFPLGTGSGTPGGVLREVIYYSSRTATVLTVPAAGRALLGTVAGAGASSDKLYPVPGIAIGLDTHGVQTAGAAILTVANETTAPAGVVWNLGIEATTGLQIGSLGGTAGVIGTQQQIGVWIKRQVPAGAVSNPNNLVLLQDSFVAA